MLKSTPNKYVIKRPQYFADQHRQSIEENLDTNTEISNNLKCFETTAKFKKTCHKDDCQQWFPHLSKY